MTRTLVRDVLLWRDARRSCECRYEAGRWILRLLGAGDVVLRTFAAGTAREIAHVSRTWRRASPPGSHCRVVDATTERIRVPGGDRRHYPAERRAVARGGRRAADPGR
jgi:hypothetical protein